MAEVRIRSRQPADLRRAKSVITASPALDVKLEINAAVLADEIFQRSYAVKVAAFIKKKRGLLLGRSLPLANRDS